MALAGSRATPLGAVARGLLAGVVGTGAMGAWQSLAARLQSSEGESKPSSEPAKDPWEEASAPAKVAKRIGEGVFHRDVPAEKIGLLTNVMHWGYGTTWGSVYGLLAGTVVPMGLYEPPWKYPPKELALDLSYRLAYGGATATAYRILDS
jgi:hypothetical protein